MLPFSDLTPPCMLPLCGMRQALWLHPAAARSQPRPHMVRRLQAPLPYLQPQGAARNRYDNCLIITTPSMFSMGAKNRDLGCSLHPACLAGPGCKPRHESRTQTSNPRHVHDWCVRASPSLLATRPPPLPLPKSCWILRVPPLWIPAPRLCWWVLVLVLVRHHCCPRRRLTTATWHRMPTSRSVGHQ